MATIPSSIFSLRGEGHLKKFLWITGRAHGCPAARRHPLAVGRQPGRAAGPRPGCRLHGPSPRATGTLTQHLSFGRPRAITDQQGLAMCTKPAHRRAAYPPDDCARRYCAISRQAYPPVFSASCSPASPLLTHATRCMAASLTS